MFPSGLQYVVGMSLVLGAVSYGIGLAPLSVPLSKKQLSVLSNLGTGLLIGTAIGNWCTGERSSYSFNIGLPILLGFAGNRAYPLSLGLIIHALIDGYALGVSASNTRSPNLSIIVFLAISVHKALLANSLPVMECKRYLLYFSLATPVSSILTYGLYAFNSEKNTGTWAGNALLFSVSHFKGTW
ncbi:hypothetical protein EV363DRAFT_1324699, partial [Boletus edulis]